MKLLANAVAATGAQTEVSIEAALAKKPVVQSEGLNTWTVLVQGRLAPTLAWVTLATLTDVNPVAEIVRMPEVRANVTALGVSGDVTVAIDR